MPVVAGCLVFYTLSRKKFHKIAQIVTIWLGTHLFKCIFGKSITLLSKNEAIYQNRPLARLEYRSIWKSKGLYAWKKLFRVQKWCVFGVFWLAFRKFTNDPQNWIRSSHSYKRMASGSRLSEQNRTTVRYGENRFSKSIKVYKNYVFRFKRNFRDKQKRFLTFESLNFFNKRWVVDKVINKQVKRVERAAIEIDQRLEMRFEIFEKIAHIKTEPQKVHKTCKASLPVFYGAKTWKRIVTEITIFRIDFF